MTAGGTWVRLQRLFILFCIAAALCPPAHAATFAPRVNFTTGASPAGGAAGDLNADGIIDLVIANAGADTVSVLRGTGDGRFAAKADFPTGDQPLDVALADLNRDGRLDIVVVNAAAHTVSVLTGNGDATFRPKSDFATGSMPYGIAVADVDDDGRADLLTANLNASSISVLAGSGSGSFGAHVEYATGGNPQSVAVADFNRDGNLDLVTANYGSNTSSVLLGSGTGTFGPKADFVMGASPGAIAVADLDADGDADLVTSNFSGASLSVRLGNGSGGFGAKSDYGAGAAPADVAIADVDHDGRLDLISADYTAQTISVLHGNGDGTFAERIHFATEGVAMAVVIGDFDRDARPDLAATNWNRASVSVLMNATVLPPSGAFAPAVRYPMPVTAFPEAMVLADMNRDGNLDAVTSNMSGDGVSILPGVGDGSFGAATTWGVGTDTRPSGIAAADLDEDGYLDLVFIKSTTDSVGVMFSNHSGGYGPGVFTFATGDNPEGLAVGDVNGDAKPDVVTANHAAKSVSVLLGDGAGGFGAKQDYPTGNFADAVAIGDLDLNGIADLAVAGPKGNDSVSILFGAGSGRFGSAIDIESGTAQPNSVAIGDLNRDGRPDLVAVSLMADELAILAGDGEGNFAPPVTHETAYFAQNAAIGDVNRDGVPDVAVAATGASCVSVYRGTGTGSLGARTDHALGDNSGTYVVAIADVNRDGMDDLVAAAYNSSKIAVFLNTAPPSADLAVTLVASPATTAVGGTLTYIATISNNGPGAATGVTLIDRLAPGLELLSVTPVIGTCSGAPLITCAIGSLASGAATTVTVEATVVAPGALVNRAAVVGNVVDPVPTNDADFVVRTVFTDDPLAAGTTFVKAVHLTELRGAIDVMRELAGLSVAKYPTDPLVLPHETGIKAAHLNAACVALKAAYPAAPCSAVTVGAQVRAADFTALRAAVKSVQ